MPTFNIVLDTRKVKKGGRYNLAVRVINGRDVMYINLQKISMEQYDQIFNKKSMDENSIQFRETCNQYITKCERIIKKVDPYNKKRFREMFWEKDKVISSSLLLKELFDFYLTHNKEIKLKTRSHFKGTANVLESYKNGISVADINPAFLKGFEKRKMEDGYSRATVDSHFRNLRRIINYFKNEDKQIPEQYQYPFGKSGYSISSFFPNKIVLKTEEIQSIIEYTDFETPEQEYSRDIWLLLYYCNGANFADLLRMRWDQIIGDYILFTRRKTETTRKNNIKSIVVPITQKLKSVIIKIGDKDSPFMLGLLKDGYTESYFENKNHKIKQQINRNLSWLSKKLNLSVPLNLSTARDSYASTLMRMGKSRDDIGQMLGHSNSIVTEHYLSSIDPERTFEINSVLL
jgi:integrase